MEAATGSLDILLDCASQQHDFAPYVKALALDGTLVSLGYLGQMSMPIVDLLVGRKKFTSSGSGGRRYTQDLLDFCGKHGVTPEVEVLPVGEVNTAVDRLAANDVRYRFVLDMHS